MIALWWQTAPLEARLPNASRALLSIERFESLCFVNRKYTFRHQLFILELSPFNCTQTPTPLSPTNFLFLSLDSKEKQAVLTMELITYCCIVPYDDLCAHHGVPRHHNLPPLAVFLVTLARPTLYHPQTSPAEEQIVKQDKTDCITFIPRYSE